MPSIRQRIGSWLTGQKAGGNNWFIDFMKIASDEDAGAGDVTIANAYKNVAWVNIAVATRARNLARAPFLLYRGDTEVESGREYDLFAKAGTQLWEGTEGWRCLRGEAVWILGWGGAVGFPIRIVVPDPSNMVAHLTKDGLDVAYWEYVGGGQKIPFKPEEIIHFSMWNPYDAIRGMSELTPIMDEVSQDYMMSRGTKKLLNNQSIPGGIITIPGDSTDENEVQRVIEKWEKKHKGVNRAGGVAVLANGATYEKISLSPQEMQSFEMRGWNRDTILAKFGVPHAVVGLKAEVGSLSGKDTAEQMKAFWNLTLIPECEYFQKRLEEKFFSKYAPGMSGEFDTSGLWEMQADEELLSNRLRMDTQSGILTINEARELKGMDPVDWGDTWWRPMGLVDVQEEPEPVPDALTPFAGQNNPPKEDEEEPEEEMPMDEEGDVKSLFVKKGRPSIYTPAYREMRWKSQYDPVDKIETAYAKALKNVFYKMRQDQLAKLMEYGGQAAIQNSTLEALTGEPLWDTYWRDIQKVSNTYLTQGVDVVDGELKSLFTDLGVMSMDSAWSIWDTRAKELLQYRVNQGSLALVPTTVQDGIKEKLGAALEGGWSIDETADALRDTFNIAQNRAPMIARTELGGAINDARIAGFKDVGFKKHEWVSSRDGNVRESHQEANLDSTVVEIGQRFSNGLLYPNDPGGEASEVINCRCITLPVFEE